MGTRHQSAYGILEDVADIKTDVPLIEGLSLSPFSAERRGWAGPDDGDGVDMVPRQTHDGFADTSAEVHYVRY